MIFQKSNPAKDDDKVVGSVSYVIQNEKFKNPDVIVPVYEPLNELQQPKLLEAKSPSTRQYISEAHVSDVGTPKRKRKAQSTKDNVSLINFMDNVINLKFMSHDCVFNLFKSIIFSLILIQVQKEQMVIRL